MTYILLQYEQYKKGASEGKQHFPLSLSGNFTLTSEADFIQQSFFLYTFFKEYYSNNFIVHL